MANCVGIDEVGRGCWAGPLVAGAVILPDNFDTTTIRPWKLDDSKKLSRRQREAADLGIREVAVSIGIGWVSPTEIDDYGLTWAVETAMGRALAEVKPVYSEIIIDGNVKYLEKNRMIKHMLKHMVHADALVPCVSAASIVAKVARDNYMSTLSEKYAGYGFERHVGYGTAAHIVALKNLGVSDIHRRSFKPIKALLE
ncbi:MAG: ribonuclease HII [Candidatus Saccharimonadales bacterium]